MEQNEIRDRIIKVFRQRVPRAKLPDPEQLRVEQGNWRDCVRLCLTAETVEKNMQSNSAAFEGWALLIHVYCKFQVELDLDLEHAPSGQPARGHYQRFLYRALKFSQQYSSWFSLSERPRAAGGAVQAVPVSRRITSPSQSNVLQRAPV